MIVWKSSEIEIDHAKVLHFLGYNPANSAKINKRIVRIIRQELEHASCLLSGQGHYIRSSADMFRGSALFSDADALAFGLVTIGRELESKVQQLFQKGEGCRAVVLDAIGSVAVEAVADKLNQIMIEGAREQYSFVTRRFSPGYGCWPVTGQQLIFEQFAGVEEMLGVRLSSSMLMNPLKSVSFVVKLGKGELKEINEGSCDSCANKLACLERKSGQLCSIAMN